MAFGKQCKRDGSAAVEFALVGPLFILLLVGGVVYGGWLWMAQSVQHLASEGARAAVAGLDDDERDGLARAAVVGAVAEGSGLDSARTVVTVTTDAGGVTVQIDYDASAHPLMALSGLLPAAPPATIRRAAVVRTGGY